MMSSNLQDVSWRFELPRFICSEGNKYALRLYNRNIEHIIVNGRVLSYDELNDKYQKILKMGSRVNFTLSATGDICIYADEATIWYPAVTTEETLARIIVDYRCNKTVIRTLGSHPVNRSVERTGRREASTLGGLSDALLNYIMSFIEINHIETVLRRIKLFANVEITSFFDSFTNIKTRLETNLDLLNHGTYNEADLICRPCDAKMMNSALKLFCKFGNGFIIEVLVKLLQTKLFVISGEFATNIALFLNECDVASFTDEHEVKHEEVFCREIYMFCVSSMETDELERILDNILKQFPFETTTNWETGKVLPFAHVVDGYMEICLGDIVLNICCHVNSTLAEAIHLHNAYAIGQFGISYDNDCFNLHYTKAASYAMRKKVILHYGALSNFRNTMNKMMPWLRMDFVILHVTKYNRIYNVMYDSKRTNGRHANYFSQEQLDTDVISFTDIDLQDFLMTDIQSFLDNLSPQKCRKLCARLDDPLYVAEYAHVRLMHHSPYSSEKSHIKSFKTFRLLDLENETDTTKHVMDNKIWNIEPLSHLAPHQPFTMPSQPPKPTSFFTRMPPKKLLIDELMMQQDDYFVPLKNNRIYW